VKNLMVATPKTDVALVLSSSAMGRKAGHLAMGIGKAAGATADAHPRGVPQAPHPQCSRSSTRWWARSSKRLSYGRRDGVAVIAEGVTLDIDPQGSRPAQGRGRRDAPRSPAHRRDQHGRDPQARGAGAPARLPAVKTTVVAKNIGYELRCADPVPVDMEIHARPRLLRGQVPHRGRQRRHGVDAGRALRPHPLLRAARQRTGKARIRLVDVRSTRLRHRPPLHDRVRRDDFEDPQELAKFATTAGISG